MARQTPPPAGPRAFRPAADRAPIHLFILTPMYGGLCHGAYTQSLLQLPNAMNRPATISYGFAFNESLVQRARNALVKTALASDATHIMFIDADIRFNPGDIATMIDADRDVIAGIYPKKEINWGSIRQAIAAGVPDSQLHQYTGSFVVSLVDQQRGAHVPVHQPVEVMDAGTGFMLIKRGVFGTLKAAGLVDSYRSDVVDLGRTVQHGSDIDEYFKVPIEPGTKRLLSEDYAFCRLCQQAGIKIHIAPWVRLAHFGTYAFEGQLMASRLAPAGS